MKIIKISVALMLLFLITSDARGYFMENKVKSDTYSVNSLDHTGKVLEVRIPSGNIIIERNGALNVDYYFEYNADNATPAVANEIFGKCKIKFRNNVLTAEYPELQSGWLNAHYNMTVPQDVSLKIYLGAGKVSVMGIGLADVAVEVDSGKITFDNVQIAGAARLLLSSGNIRVANSKVGGDGLLSVGSGKITLQRPEFKKDSSVIVQKGKIHYQYDPGNTGKISYVGNSDRKSRVNFNAGKSCTLNGNTLVCAEQLPEIKVDVKKGRLEILPTD